MYSRRLNCSTCARPWHPHSLCGQSLDLTDQIAARAPAPQGRQVKHRGGRLRHPDPLAPTAAGQMTVARKASTLTIRTKLTRSYCIVGMSPIFGVHCQCQGVTVALQFRWDTPDFMRIQRCPGWLNGRRWLVRMNRLGVYFFRTVEYIHVFDLRYLRDCLPLRLSLDIQH